MNFKKIGGKWSQKIIVQCFSTSDLVLPFNIQILMNVRRRRHVNAMNATAKTHGAVTSAVAAAVCCISRTMIPASVSSTAKYILTIHLYKLCILSWFCSYAISCAGKNTTEVKSSWAPLWIILIVLGLAGVASYVVYKHRLRVSFRSMFQHWRLDYLLFS